jgi:hypothetical protein
MWYEIKGRGGLYPEGCAFAASTAAGAIERYHAVQVACGSARAYASGKPVSRFDLMKFAEAELAPTSRSGEAAPLSPGG